MEDLIYVASILDQSSMMTIQKKDTTYSTYMRVRRDEVEILTVLIKVLGGKIGYSEYDKMYTVDFIGHYSTEPLKKILPYLRARRAHAELILTMNEVLDRKKKQGRKRQKYTEIEKIELNDLYQKMLKLNGQSK